MPLAALNVKVNKVSGVGSGTATGVEEFVLFQKRDVRHVGLQPVPILTN